MSSSSSLFLRLMFDSSSLSSTDRSSGTEKHDGENTEDITLKENKSTKRSKTGLLNQI